MKCPCRYCEERHVGCHGDCPRYMEWTGQLKELREDRDADAMINSVAGDRRRRKEKYNKHVHFA